METWDARDIIAATEPGLGGRPAELSISAEFISTYDLENLLNSGKDAEAICAELRKAIR